MFFAMFGEINSAARSKEQAEKKRKKVATLNCSERLNKEEDVNNCTHGRRASYTG